MTAISTFPRWLSVLRWVARVWGLLVFAFALFVIFQPDPYATEPVPAADWFLLSLWGVSILGLLIAWRWELAGGLLTLGTMLLREAAWLVLKGEWLVNFLIIWVVIAPPALMFLYSWWWKSQHKAGQIG